MVLDGPVDATCTRKQLRDANFPLFSVIFGLFVLRRSVVFHFFPQLFRLLKVKIDNAWHRRIVPLTRPPPIHIFNGNAMCEGSAHA